MINNIIKKFKENVSWLFLIELLYLSFSFLIGFFGYKEIRSRLDLVNTLGPKLNEIAARLQGQDLVASDVVELSNQLANVETNVQTLKLLVILVPLGLFLVYLFFQGISWYTLSKARFDVKKLMDRKYLLSFFGISLIYFVILYSFWYLLFSALSLNTFFLAITLITLILFYFLFVSYGILPRNEGIFTSLKKGISIGFSNVARLIPIFLGFFIIMFVLLFLATSFTNIIIYIIIGIFLVLIWILFKITLTERLKKLI